MFDFNQPTYQRLRDIHAEERKPIAFWLGAGFSTPAGLPLWPHLRDRIVDEAIRGLGANLDTEANIKQERLERAKLETNYWSAFEEIKDVMGKAEYNASIRNTFTLRNDVEVPELYKEVWSLSKVKAILSLNVDGFAAKAHRRVRTEEDVAVFNGKDAPAYAHLLGMRRPFIANLHGVIDDSNSWVFTKGDVEALFAVPAYQHFLNMVFSSMTVVFAGVSADDVAAGGTLRKLTDQGMDLGDHFWITDRSSAHAWASHSGLQIIKYAPDLNFKDHRSHVSPLKEMFHDIREYKSFDAKAGTVIPKVEEVISLPRPSELRVKDTDELRLILSGYAKKLLNENKSDTNAEEYINFLDEYSENIHQSWHVTVRPPKNTFYGYRVVRQIRSSPFSTVWELEAADKSTLALKILKNENLHSGPQIESFRRGVKSLEYLTQAQVPGTAALVSAFEIPTAVIMNFVEGSSLAELVNAQTIETSAEKFVIMQNVCKHLIFSHNLPQGVLHRDVRPSNIMLPYIYWPEDDAVAQGFSRLQVVLLNYDLSWHSSAKGETISGNLEEIGYYAPEQSKGKGELARSTLVDSYGVGMCIFNIFTNQTPPTSGSSFGDWKNLVSKQLKFETRLLWRSAPERVRRLIMQSTHPQSDERMHMTQIEIELGLLSDAVQGKWNNLPLHFWAEELMIRCEEADYLTSSDGSEFSRSPRVGREIFLKGDLKSKSVRLKFQNKSLDATNWSGVDKMWSDKINKAKDIFISNGWSWDDNSRYSAREFNIFASISVNKLVENLDSVVQGIKRALMQVRLD